MLPLKRSAALPPRIWVSSFPQPACGLHCVCTGLPDPDTVVISVTDGTRGSTQAIRVPFTASARDLLDLFAAHDCDIRLAGNPWNVTTHGLAHGFHLVLQEAAHVSPLPDVPGETTPPPRLPSPHRVRDGDAASDASREILTLAACLPEPDAAFGFGTTKAMRAERLAAYERANLIPRTSGLTVKHAVAFCVWESLPFSRRICCLMSSSFLSTVLFRHILFEPLGRLLQLAV